MKRVSVDIETKGTRVGSVILSIGAVVFTADGVAVGADRFYAEISQSSCEALGMTTDERTMTEFWHVQPPEAKEILTRTARGGEHIQYVLGRLAQWVASQGEGVQVWGNGAAFDNAHLSDAYARVGMSAPWRFTNDMCMRTAREMTCGLVEREASEVPHHALHDAVAQAKYIAATLKLRDTLLEKAGYLVDDDLWPGAGEGGTVRQAGVAA